MDYSVSGYLDRLNTILAPESAFVTGEVSEWKVYPSGIYFSLKDKEDGSVLRAYMHPSVFRSAGLQVQIGMEVKLGGSASVYKPTGQFNFRASSIELVGEGALKKAYELLLKKLKEEGLFDRKRPIPERIERVGIISSRGGVVIQDFRKNLLSRGFKLFLIDSRVEGAQAVLDLTHALQQFNRTMPDLDVIFIIRGGGSLESMQAFNNELVCREIFASKIPVIAGIGHDVDVPIATMVADISVSTPTAAAHVVNSSWQRVDDRFRRAQEGLLGGYDSVLDTTRQAVIRRAHTIIAGYRKIFLTFSKYEQSVRNGWIRIARELKTSREESTRFVQRISALFLRSLTQKSEQVSRTEKLLELVNPERTLRLGYTIAFDEEGHVLKSARKLKKGGEIKTQFSDGVVRAKVEEILL